MTISEALTQLKAFARIDGAIVAALWTASFVATLLSPTSAIGSTLALATPLCGRCTHHQFQRPRPRRGYLGAKRCRPRMVYRSLRQHPLCRGAVCLLPILRPRLLRSHDYRGRQDTHAGLQGTGHGHQDPDRVYRHAGRAHPHPVCPALHVAESVCRHPAMPAHSTGMPPERTEKTQEKPQV